MVRANLVETWEKIKRGELKPREDDIFNNIDSQKPSKFIKYVKDKRGKIREASKEYVLEKDEQEVTLEEYKEQQKNLTVKKVISGYEDHNIIKLDNYLGNARQLYEVQPYFYDINSIFWLWDFKNNYYKITDEVRLIDLFDMRLRLAGQTINFKVKTNYIEAFKRYGSRMIPKDAPTKWIQFKDKAYSISSGEYYDVQPNYFFTNPIPHELGYSEDTPIMDKLFKEWVGEENVQTLYEIIAYSTYRAYPIHLIFCLVGSGRNGKSCFLRLLSKFIGESNIVSTELDLLTGHGSSRFESFKLYKKLICTMGETNFGIMNKSSMLKKLSGEDLIGFEMKNKNPFDGHNYAKLLIASNSLPTSQDTSEGFYRRWLIIDFPNEFPEGKDILKTIPDVEYNNLARKVCMILPGLLEKGMFSNQGTIKERQERYIAASNPLPLFIHEHCDVGDDPDEFFVGYKELFSEYLKYLKKKKKRRVLMKEFKQALENEGYYPEKIPKPMGGVDEQGYNIRKSILWVEGVRLK